MRGICVVPIIVSILILGSLGLTQDAFAETFTLLDQASCDTLEEVFRITTWSDSTCTVEGNIFLDPGDEFVIPEGVTLNFVQGATSFQAAFINAGNVINNGTIILTVDTKSTAFGELGRIANEDTGEFVNNGKIIMLLKDFAPLFQTDFHFINKGTFLNNGEIVMEGQRVTAADFRVSFMSFTSESDFVNNGKISLIAHSGTLNSITFFNSGTFTNNGLIIDDNSSVEFAEFINGATGTFTNNGVIDLDNQITGTGLVFKNFGTFNNGGVIELDNKNLSGNGFFATETSGILTNFCLGEISLGQDNSAKEIDVRIEVDSFDNAGTYVGVADPDIQDISFICAGFDELILEQQNTIDILTTENLSLRETIDELLANALATFSTVFVQPILDAIDGISSITDDASLTRTFERSLSTVDRADGIACKEATSFVDNVNALLLDDTISQNEADTLLERADDLLATCTP